MTVFKHTVSGTLYSIEHQIARMLGAAVGYYAYPHAWKGDLFLPIDGETLYFRSLSQINESFEVIEEI